MRLSDTVSQVVPDGFLASPLAISRAYPGVRVFIPTYPNALRLYIRNNDKSPLLKLVVD